jgi:hypothetical protein
MFNIKGLFYYSFPSLLYVREVVSFYFAWLKEPYMGHHCESLEAISILREDAFLKALPD